MYQRDLQKSEREWFMSMSVNQRQAHLKKVASHALIIRPGCSRRLFDAKATGSMSSSAISNQQSAGTSQSSLPNSGSLSISIKELSSVSSPSDVIVAIWSKATKLLHEVNAVVLAPGYDNAARIVKSCSGTRPHLVLRKRSGQYCCDSACPNWRSLGICAHSVAYVTWFSKAKKTPNLTKLATTNMPAGRGRKGGVPPRKRRKIQSPKTRVSFATVAGFKSARQSVGTSIGASVDANVDVSVDASAGSSTSTGGFSGSSTFMDSGHLPGGDTPEDSSQGRTMTAPDLTIAMGNPTIQNAPTSTVANVVVTGGQLNIQSQDSRLMTQYRQLPTSPTSTSSLQSIFTKFKFICLCAHVYYWKYSRLSWV